MALSASMSVSGDLLVGNNSGRMLAVFDRLCNDKGGKIEQEFDFLLAKD